MSGYLKRIVRLVVGLFICSTGIVLTLKANVGYAPWEVLHSGISQVFNIPIGVVTIITSAIIVLTAVLLGEKIGLGTLFNLVLIGVFIDLLLLLPIPPLNNLFLGILVLVIGMFTFSFGIYFYISSGFSAGPRDSLMIALKRKTPFPVSVCRSLVELLALLMGWWLGGKIGVGTLIYVTCMGFSIQLVFQIANFKPTEVAHETLGDTYKKAKRFLVRLYENKKEQETNEQNGQNP